MTHNLENLSIIHGTGRFQDTIPAMMEALRTISPEHYAGLMVSPFGAIPAYAMEDDDAEWWESDLAWEVYTDLEGLLNECAPEGFYFGAHPGDGSDLGFWAVED